MPTHGPDGLQTATIDDVRRLLQAVIAVHSATGPQRAAVLAGRVAALMDADGAAVDVETPDGSSERLAAAGTDLGREVERTGDDFVAGGDVLREVSDASTIAAADPVVTVWHPPSAVRPAVVRSVCQHDETTSTLWARRATAFEPRHVVLLRLFHPHVAWAVAPPTVPTLPGAAGDVLEQLLVGLREKEIAARLGRSAHTVHAHIKRVYRHFGVRSRPELIVRHFGGAVSERERVPRR